MPHMLLGQGETSREFLTTKGCAEIKFWQANRRLSLKI